jgi:hypothetical protein
MYVVPERSRFGVGAFARPINGVVGDAPSEPQLIGDLQRSIATAVLDQNQSPLIPAEDRDPNFGHYGMTSDNATVVTHGIDHEHGYTASVTGARLRMQNLGIAVLPNPAYPDLPPAVIARPPEVMIPQREPRLDYLYAHATAESLGRGDDAARRLRRAIDWLYLAGLNNTVLTSDMRIPALDAGFEVLLDQHAFLEIAASLATLLEDETQAVERNWTTLSGRPDSRQLSDIAWWYLRFSFLRNDLMHGRSPDPDAWQHSDAAQIDLGEWYLAQAIKHTVGNDGHQGVLDTLHHSRLSLAALEYWREQKAKLSTTAEPELPGA